MHACDPQLAKEQRRVLGDLSAATLFQGHLENQFEQITHLSRA
jgi:hypothetical protein